MKTESRQTIVAEIIGLALLYFAAARVGQLLALPPGNVTPVWIPSGIILAAVLWRGHRIWPGIFLGAFAGNVWAYFQTDSVSAVLRCLAAGTANGIGDTLGAVGGAYLITRTTGSQNPFDTVRNVLRFLFYGVVLGSAVSAICGVTALSLTGFVPWPHYGNALVTWWTGDGVGILLLTPLLWAWQTGGWRNCRFGWEELLFAVGLIPVSFTALAWVPDVPGLVILPAFLWVIFRFDRRVAFSLLFLEAAAVIGLTIAGRGPFIVGNVNNSLVGLQFFLALMTIPSLVVSGVLAEAAQLRAQLKDRNQELHVHVERRTAQLARELTGRQQAEAKARDSEECYRTVVENDIFPIFVSQDLKFVYLNPAAVQLFGAQRAEQLVGQSVLARIHPDYHAGIRQQNVQLESGQRNAVPAQDEIYLRLNGTQVPVEVTAAPFHHETMAGVVVFARDIGVQRAAEQELAATLTQLREAQQQLARKEKLRSLGQMANGIAHDFNNALSPILGFSEILLKQPAILANPQQLRQWLTYINTAATDAGKIVARIREFSRQEIAGADFRTIDLNPLIRQVIDLTEPRWKSQAQAAGRRIHVLSDLQPVPAILGEEFAIREVLTNLVFNAIDALPDGGMITLGTAVEGGFVRLWVSDTGAGMTEEVRQRCLEPYFTTKGENGTGLGLAMVQGIVQRHSGTLDIESGVDRGGTRITIRLPILRADSAGAVLAEKSWRIPPRRILVVDDEPLLCLLIESFLTTDNHAVTAVTTGSAALAQLTTGRFDVVITDLSMPEINGEELAAEISQIAPRVPVILMTGFGDLMKADGRTRPHIQTILSKPITEAKLRTALAEATLERAAGLAVENSKGGPSGTNLWHAS